ncbi:late control protein [Acidovorax sp. SUPP1855]|uniref:contractile injection system protein, VgrG/Pvc8 family n=1 Tax=Acidovorax sp. SUPP1855 TaxID=431774 RepID=UPI0023DE29FA|nr:contractile injection system protein, VgrG/Pvc8 family [Acidovorax sp. SUPP1855]GKS83228.1 late control protein [Acidovorax sp. SUPP1855]
MGDVIEGSAYAADEPGYSLVVDGRNITAKIEPRLISLTLTEARAGEADELCIELDDSDGAVVLPSTGASIELRLGWAAQLVDKGTFTVDEIEHHGAPDLVSIRARSADLRKRLRIRAEHSYHDTTIGQIVGTIAARNNLIARVDDRLAGVHVQHFDQTHESDLNFITRLARRYDAVATVKKGHLLFLPTSGTRTSSGASLAPVTITRREGDQHRYHTADRHAYSGVRAYWQDPKRARRRGVIAGVKGNEKKLKETYSSEADAMAAARAERERIERGKATFELTLAMGRPELMPQTPVTVSGFKPQIDATDWQVVKLTHTLGDQGLTTRMELERAGSPEGASTAGAPVPDDDAPGDYED